MSVVTEEQVLSVMQYLAAAYPQREIGPATVAVYVIQIMRARLTADALLLAAMNLVDTSQWIPTVAELIGETRRIEGARAGWFQTWNYWHLGEPIPDELFLPPGMGREWLGYEPEMTEDIRGALGYESRGADCLELEAANDR